MALKNNIYAYVNDWSNFNRKGYVSACCFGMNFLLRLSTVHYSELRVDIFLFAELW